jgi:hypothetical protein
MGKYLGLKIFALLAAIFIWLQFTLISEHTSKVKLDLHLRNNVIADTLLHQPPKVVCEVKGKGLDILRLSLSKTYIEMDANDFLLERFDRFVIKDIPENLNLNFTAINRASLIADLTKDNNKPSGFDSKIESNQIYTNTNDEAQRAINTNRSADNSLEPEKIVLIPDLSFSAPVGRRYFPDRVTVKIKGAKTAVSSASKNIQVSISEASDTGGFAQIEVKVPKGITLLDYTPRQVRLIK